LLAASVVGFANAPVAPAGPEPEPGPPAPERQTQADAEKKSAGCMTCHKETDRHTMHANPAVILGCTDCRGGKAAVVKPEGAEQHGSNEADYHAAMKEAHVLPRFPGEWKTAANPEISYTLLNRESPVFVRFINPS